MCGAMLARRFLYVIAALVGLVLLAGLAWALFQDQLLRATFVPTVPFRPMPEAGAPDYARARDWVARPDLADDPSRWLPPGVAPSRRMPAAVFFVAPTTYLKKSGWNAPLDDAEANGRLNLFVRSQASAFTGVGQVWAPRYRQAGIGAFLTGVADAEKALDFAYRDVERAFDAFVAALPPGQPIILAGHSQGSRHLTRLLAEKVAGRPLARRIVAAYVIGWPVSVAADLPALGLPACERADQARCLVSFQSFAEPADPEQIVEIYDRSRGFTGRPRRGTAMVCTNPVTGGGTSSPAAANRGSLVPDLTFTAATLERGRVPARCAPPGVLLVGPPPEGFGRFVLRGNNYHVFDYALFWADIRADAARRLAAFR